MKKCREWAHNANHHSGDGFQVSPEGIASLTDAELGELMTGLFRAQAHRCGSPQTKVRVRTEEKAKDGGCVGWTSKPVTKDDWLGDADPCWQLKAGTSGAPARLKNEVGKPLPKNTLEAGGRFVAVAAGSTNGIKGERDRMQTLTDEAVAAGIPIEHIDVIGSELMLPLRFCVRALLQVPINGLFRA